MNKKLLFGLGMVMLLGIMPIVAAQFTDVVGRPFSVGARNFNSFFQGGWRAYDEFILFGLLFLLLFVAFYMALGKAMGGSNRQTATLAFIIAFASALSIVAGTNFTIDSFAYVAMGLAFLILTILIQSLLIKAGMEKHKFAAFILALLIALFLAFLLGKLLSSGSFGLPDFGGFGGGISSGGGFFEGSMDGLKGFFGSLKSKIVGGGTQTVGSGSATVGSGGGGGAVGGEGPIGPPAPPRPETTTEVEVPKEKGFFSKIPIWVLILIPLLLGGAGFGIYKARKRIRSGVKGVGKGLKRTRAEIAALFTFTINRKGVAKRKIRKYMLKKKLVTKKLINRYWGRSTKGLRLLDRELAYLKDVDTNRFNLILKRLIRDYKKWGAYNGKLSHILINLRSIEHAFIVRQFGVNERDIQGLVKRITQRWRDWRTGGESGISRIAVQPYIHYEELIHQVQTTLDEYKRTGQINIVQNNRLIQAALAVLVLIERYEDPFLPTERNVVELELRELEESGKEGQTARRGERPWVEERRTKIEQLVKSFFYSIEGKIVERECGYALLDELVKAVGRQQEMMKQLGGELPAQQPPGGGPQPPGGGGPGGGHGAGGGGGGPQPGGGGPQAGRRGWIQRARDWIGGFKQRREAAQQEAQRRAQQAAAQAAQAGDQQGQQLAFQWGQEVEEEAEQLEEGEEELDEEVEEAEEIEEEVEGDEEGFREWTRDDLEEVPPGTRIIGRVEDAVQDVQKGLEHEDAALSKEEAAAAAIPAGPERAEEVQQIREGQKEVTALKGWTTRSMEWLRRQGGKITQENAKKVTSYLGTTIWKQMTLHDLRLRRFEKKARRGPMIQINLVKGHTAKGTPRIEQKDQTVKAMLSELNELQREARTLLTKIPEDNSPDTSILITQFRDVMRRMDEIKLVAQKVDMIFNLGERNAAILNDTERKRGLIRRGPAVDERNPIIHSLIEEDLGDRGEYQRILQLLSIEVRDFRERMDDLRGEWNRRYAVRRQEYEKGSRQGRRPSNRAREKREWQRAAAEEIEGMYAEERETSPEEEPLIEPEGLSEAVETAGEGLDELSPEEAERLRKIRRKV